MTNQEYIKQLDIESLAELLVREIKVNEGDENLDGDWEDFYMDYYECPNGETFYDYGDAVENTSNWLKQERRHR